MNPTKLKRAVIKEELVALTGDYRRALILNQFIYWTGIKNEADKMVAEELLMARKNGEEVDYQPMYGWIYKSADELSGELMIGLSKSNIRKYIKELVAMGFMNERKNPRHKWDKTLQYRANLMFIQAELEKLGYSLEGYSLTATRGSNLEHQHNSKENNRSSKIEHHGADLEHSSHDIEHRGESFETAIPEITTETTSKVTTENNKESAPSRFEKGHLLNDLLEQQNETPTSGKVDASRKRKKSDDSSISQKRAYGEFKNVLLLDEELAKLQENIPSYQGLIEDLSTYMESTGKKYKSHYATILAWARKDAKSPKRPNKHDPEPDYSYGIEGIDHL